MLRKIISLSKSGIKAVQLRQKHSASGEVLELAKKLKRNVDGKVTKIIVNDRFDIALLAGLGGVHAVTNGITAGYIKKFCKDMISGKSVHSLAEALRAEKDGFNYVLFGPVYRTPSKVKFGKPQGLEKLRVVCSKVSIPVIAVGGINPMRAEKCLNAGAYGVAAISDLFNSQNIKGKISQYKKVLGEL
ncbi:MAG: thiamine phosphate synthase [Ignavibacteriales bacterium]|nr:thiamine phosphate synthase [Ignavibacteriales bacterium]